MYDPIPDTNPQAMYFLRLLLEEGPRPAQQESAEWGYAQNLWDAGLVDVWDDYSTASPAPDPYTPFPEPPTPLLQFTLTITRTVRIARGAETEVRALLAAAELQRTRGGSDGGGP